MVLSFSWHTYLVFVGFHKNKVEVLDWVTPDRHWSGISWPVHSEGRKLESIKVEEDAAIERLFKIAEMVKTKLSTIIREGAFKNLGKQELLLSLHNLLKPYTALAVRQAYAFKVAINNAIEVEIEKYFPFSLNGEDLLEIWQPRGEGYLC